MAARQLQMSSNAGPRQVDLASIAVFRIAFGALMLASIVRSWLQGEIGAAYAEPPFHFTYFAFGWVRPWPGIGMWIHFGALAVLACFLMLGLAYRWSAALFTVGYTYVFLLDQALYLNHAYLFCLLSGLLTLVPAHRLWSVDAWRHPCWRAEVGPAWSLGLLRFQVGLVYFYGGVAKLHSDWLAGSPLRAWFLARSELVPIHDLVASGGLMPALGWGTALFDVLITPACLWKPTRVPAFGLAVLFHLLNAWLWDIGVFPWMMITATTLFLDPSWPRRWLGKRRRTEEPLVTASNDMTNVVCVGGLEAPTPAPRRLRALPVFLAAYGTLQVLVPLRHWLYPGDVLWTEEGHRFAWRMMLREKPGDVYFHVVDRASGREWLVDPRTYLTDRQYYMMATYPDMILQFAHHLAAQLRARGVESVAVYALAAASLHERPPHLLIDPTIDLAQTPRTLWPAHWILPYGTPLPSAIEIGGRKVPLQWRLDRLVRR